MYCVAKVCIKMSGTKGKIDPTLSGNEMLLISSNYVVLVYIIAINITYLSPSIFKSGTMCVEIAIYVDTNPKYLPAIVSYNIL